MNIPSLLAELRSRDIRVWIEGDRLRCDGPPSVLTPELREQLRAAKADLLNFLRNAESLSHQQRAIVPLQPRGRRQPLFAVGGHNGDVFCYRTLVRCLGQDQPFYGLQPPGADGQGDPLARVEDIAAYFAAQIRAFQPDGPYRLVGFCAGGTIAFELAHQLIRAGAQVGLLAMIASPYPGEFRLIPKARRYLREQWRRVRKHAPVLLRSPAEQYRYIAGALARHQAHKMEDERLREDPLRSRLDQVGKTTLAALARYRPAPYPDRFHLFVPGRDWTDPGGPSARWRAVGSPVEEHYGPAGSHTDDIMGALHAPVFAEIFRTCLEGGGQGEAVVRQAGGWR